MADKMFAMMKEFVGDWLRYRTQLAAHERWIRRFAARKGYSVNSRAMVYMNLKLWLADSETTFGKRICPCFEPSGQDALDKKLICPCAFLDDEIAERGWCHCTLFGRGDLTASDYKVAEEQLMAEYRGVPIKLDPIARTLDTRGMPLDPLRGLPVPDSLHQTKRAINAIGLPLTVTVATDQEAANLQAVGRSRGWTVTVDPNNDTPERRVLIEKP